MDERNIETMDFAGYEIVGKEMFVRKDFWIDFIPVKKDHHIFIPKACMTQLGNPPYVTILMDPEEKLLIIRPCWRKKEGKGWHAPRLSTTLITGPEGAIIETCEPIFRKIAEIAGWGGELKAKHRIYGNAVNTDGSSPLLLFSLNEAEVFISAEDNSSSTSATDEENR